LKAPIRHGGLYLADLNPRQGTEPGKDHPSTWVLPCTTRLTGENLLRVPLPRGMAGNAVECEVMIDQSRSIDNRRFRRPLGLLPRPVLSEIKLKLKLLADL